MRSWLWCAPVEQEVEEEIAFHVEMRTRAQVERGIEPQIGPAAAAALGRLISSFPCGVQPLDPVTSATVGALIAAAAALAAAGPAIPATRVDPAFTFRAE